MMDAMLKAGNANSSICLSRLQQERFTGSLATVKRHIDANCHLIPAKRQFVASQGSQEQRFPSDPGEAFQMDWGFTKVVDYRGAVFQAAYFAIICHHCGQRYVELSPTPSRKTSS